MKTKIIIREGNIKLVLDAKTNEATVYNLNLPLFSTEHPKVLLDLSKAIAMLAQKLLLGDRK